MSVCVVCLPAILEKRRNMREMSLCMLLSSSTFSPLPSFSSSSCTSSQCLVKGKVELCKHACMSNRLLVF